jgi:regulator of sirC expression with transglutaminase-like and TPR domain
LQFQLPFAGFLGILIRMSTRLPFEPPDPRLAPAPDGELFRRQRRVALLLDEAENCGAERREELTREILLAGLEALPAVQAAAVSDRPGTAAVAGRALRWLVPDKIGLEMAEGLARSEEQFPLELGAAILAKLDDPTLVPEVVVRRVDQLARRARRHIVTAIGEPLTRKSIHTRIFDIIFQLAEFWKAWGFHANRDEYYDIRSNWLPQVLERRTGLPILLSIVYLAISRRLGLKCEAIGLPWHFVVRVEVPLENSPGFVFLDPFHGAQPLDLDDCKKMVEASGQTFDPDEHLRALQPRQVMERMCNNLVAAYDQQKQFLEAERVATVMIHLGPDAPWPRLVRAERRLRRGEYRLARKDLRAVLALSPPTSLAHAATTMLKHIDYEHPF